VLLIDAGTGVQRLVEDPQLMDGVERLDVVLTHFHLDHVAGLSYLPALPLRPTLRGPGRVIAGIPTSEILDRLFGSPLFAATADELAQIEEIPHGPFEIGPFRIATRVQRLHTDPTLALRIGDALAYCTDTAAWYPQASTNDETHTASGEAGRIAREAGVRRLVLIHVNPLLRSDEELALAARAEFPDTSVGQDLVPL
jgi:phosphoribosyl 1,2-cyclic phosphodiesterase